MKWPFTGRDGDVRRALALLRDPSRSGVVFAGPPTVGRTRLLEEIVRQWRRFGDARLVTATESSRGVAFGALGALAPHDAGTPVSWSSDVTAVLGTGHRVLLGVDDAHLLDDHSALLLRHLAVETDLRIALTVRAGQPAPEAIVSLWKDGPLERLEVGPLGREANDALVERGLGGSVDSSTLTQLWDLARGHPLYLIEMVAGSRGAGTLLERGGLWVTEGALEPSHRLLDLAADLLDGLSDEQRRAVGLVALGEPLEPELAETLFPDETISPIQRRGIIVTDAHDALCCHVPALTVALRRSLTPAAVRSLSRQLVAAVDDPQALDDGPLRRLAAWSLAADGSKDTSLLLRAAAAAGEANDEAAAERFARAALPAAGAEGSLLLARILIQQGRNDEAASVLEAARGADDSPEHVARVAALRTQLAFRLGRPADAEPVLDDALERVGSTVLTGDLIAWRAMIHMLAGENLAAVARAEEVAAMEDVGADAHVVAGNAQCWSLVMLGRFAEARSRLDVTVERYGPVSGMTDVLPLLEQSRHVGTLYAVGPGRALPDCEQAYASALEADATASASVLAVTLGTIRITAGDVRGARRAATEAEHLLSVADTVSVRPQALALVARAAAEGGQPRAATSILREVEAAGGGGPGLRGHATVERARVATLAANGELASAARRAVALGLRALDAEHPAWAFLAFHDAVRLGYPEEAHGPMHQLAVEMDVPFIHAMSEQATALAAGDVARLERAANSLAEAGALLFAAEALAQAADLHGRSRRAGRANLARARATSFLARCPGAATPALRGLAEDPLTRREREVALLAGRGFSSAEIAKRLVVSRRTVDNHLSRVYRKLGIGGRSELEAALAADLETDDES